MRRIFELKIRQIKNEIIFEKKNSILTRDIFHEVFEIF